MAFPAMWRGFGEERGKKGERDNVDKGKRERKKGERRKEGKEERRMCERRKGGKVRRE